MNAKSQEHQLMVRYLLGDLSDEEVNAFEEHYFDDDAYFEEIIEVEDDLVDAYVRQLLSSDEQIRFEKYYLVTPQRAEKVRFARAFAQQLDLSNTAPAFAEKAFTVKDAEQVSLFWWQNLWNNFLNFNLFPLRFAVPALILLILGAATWIFIDRLPHRSGESSDVAQTEVDINKPAETSVENNQATTAQTNTIDSATNNNSPSNSNSPTPPKSKQDISPAAQPDNRAAPNIKRRSNIVSFALVSGTVRSTGGDNTLKLTSDVDAVELKLTLEDDGVTAHNITLQTAEGVKIWSKKRVPAQHKVVGSVKIKNLNVRVPARRLAKGNYIVAVTTAKPDEDGKIIGEYELRIEKK